MVSGLYNFRERDYSATLGRWMEVDPLGLAAGDTNPYRYIGDNPDWADDPSGVAPPPKGDPNQGAAQQRQLAKQQAIARLKQEISRLQAEIALLQAQDAADQSRIEKMMARLKDTEDRLEKNKKEYEDLRKQIDDLYKHLKDPNCTLEDEFQIRALIDAKRKQQDLLLKLRESLSNDRRYEQAILSLLNDLRRNNPNRIGTLGIQLANAQKELMELQSP